MELDLVVDNDVLIKCACYSMLKHIRPPKHSDGDVGILASARFVVWSALARNEGILDRLSARRCFDAYLQDVAILEPNDDELILASLIEEEAIQLGVDLDVGESQLCAVAVLRSSPLVLTGDKRAVEGAEALLERVQPLSSLRERVVCLEQAITGIALRIGLALASSLICAESGVDKALAICFGCNRGQDYTGSPVEGLKSYVGNLRDKAPTLLYRGDAM